jgi:FixJ family two-component response regulator
MMNAVTQHFGNNSNVWNSNPLVINGVNNLIETGKAIEEAAKKQKANSPTGHTAAKERARNELESLTYRTAVRLRSYARSTDNDVLTAKLDFSQSTLDRMKHNDLLTCSRMVVAACKEYLPKLIIYQIDNAAVDKLSQSIEQTSLLYAARDAVVDQRVEATADLEKLFTTARNQLKILDDLVEGYLDDETFIATYFNARKIHDLKGKRAKTETQNPEN